MNLEEAQSIIDSRKGSHPQMIRPFDLQWARFTVDNIESLMARYVGNEPGRKILRERYDRARALLAADTLANS